MLDPQFLKPLQHGGEEEEGKDGEGKKLITPHTPHTPHTSHTPHPARLWVRDR